MTDSARRPVIRVWKLGDLDRHILPTKEGIARLEEKLRGLKPGEDFDLVWDPAISVEYIPNGDWGTDLVVGPGVELVEGEDGTIRVEAVADQP